MTADYSRAATITTGDFTTAYHDTGAGEGEGAPLLLLHGSGPGVTAWANWRGVIARLAPGSLDRNTVLTQAPRRRLIAPDLAGFGQTRLPDGAAFTMSTWVTQVIDLLDALGIEKTDLVGNSFGGALALRLTIDHPDRVNRLVLMGSVGVHFPITEGLDFVWGYTPSLENMRKAVSLFVDDQSLVTDDLVKLRYEASTNPATRASYEAMFPAPRQRWVDAMAAPQDDIRGIRQRTLIVHGREDRIIPPRNALKLVHLIDQAELHIFGHCGHWTQIEKVDEFCQLVDWFLAAP